MSHENLKINQQIQRRGSVGPLEADKNSKKQGQNSQAGYSLYRWQQNVGFKQLINPNLLVHEYKSIDFPFKIQSLVWKPMGYHHDIRNQKNKFIIYTADFQIQEMSFHERSFATLALSSKAEICMSVGTPGNSVFDPDSPENLTYQMQTFCLISQHALQQINSTQFKYNYLKALKNNNQQVLQGSNAQIQQNNGYEHGSSPDLKLAAESKDGQELQIDIKNSNGLIENQIPWLYSEENPQQNSLSVIFKDISQLMLMRIQGGYHVDQIQRNFFLTNGFQNTFNIYSLYKPVIKIESNVYGIHKKKSMKKVSQQSLVNAQDSRSIRSFWKFISRVKDLSTEDWHDQNDSFTDSSNDLIGFNNQQVTGGLGHFSNSLATMQHPQSSLQRTSSQNAHPNSTFANKFGQQQQHWISFLSEGVRGILEKAVHSKGQEMSLDGWEKTDVKEAFLGKTGFQGSKNLSAVAKQLDQDNQQWYDFQVYTANYRRQVIHFCGWTDIVIPVWAFNQGALQSTSAKPGPSQPNSELGHFQIANKQDLERIRNDLKKCCDNCLEEDGNIDLKTKQQGCDSPFILPGASSRVTVMCCLHFDFQRAHGLFTKSRENTQSNTQIQMGQTNQVSSSFAEEQMNLNMFENIMHCFSQKQLVPPPPTDIGPKQRNQQNSMQHIIDSMNKQVAMIKQMNKNLHTQMKNPYLEFFFKLLDKSQWSDLFSYWDQSQSVAPKIDVMDFLAIMFRFLPLEKLVEYLNLFEEIGTRDGRLETLIVTGLNSPHVFLILQNYVDRTADLQTAAYIAAYAMNIQHVSGLVQERKKNKLGKFIKAYQQFLNSMQMWSARAVFDQKLGQIARTQTNLYQDLTPDSRLSAPQQPRNEDQLLNPPSYMTFGKKDPRSAAQDEYNDGGALTSNVLQDHNQIDAAKQPHDIGDNKFLISATLSSKINYEEIGYLLMFYSKYVQTQNKKGFKQGSDVSNTFRSESTQNQQQLSKSISKVNQNNKQQVNNQNDQDTERKSIIKESQKDLNSHDMYEDRHLQSDLHCYFCGKSFALKKQIAAINEKNSMMGQHGIMGGMGRPTGYGASQQNAVDTQNPNSNRCICNKDIPCCSICLKPLELNNPYFEINKQNEMNKRIKAQQTGGQSSQNRVAGGIPAFGNLNSFQMQGMGTGTSPSIFQPMSMNSLSNFGMGFQQKVGGKVEDASLNQNKQIIAHKVNLLPQPPYSQTALSNWLMWCQSCKHGGHAQHLSEWFLNFTVCPVSDCQCECSKL